MADRERIEGWKAIASHFNRGVRTVQRWERELGLPVRRRGTGRGEVVFAFADELDAWFARSDPPPASSSGPQNSPGSADDPPGTQPENGRSPWRSSRRRIALAVIIVGAAATALWLLASWRQAQGGQRTSGGGPNPVAARV